MLVVEMSKCKRCGKDLLISKESPDHELKSVCTNCITPKEEQEILKAQGKQRRKVWLSKEYLNQIKYDE